MSVFRVLQRVLGVRQTKELVPNGAIHYNLGEFARTWDHGNKVYHVVSNGNRVVGVALFKEWSKPHDMSHTLRITDDNRGEIKDSFVDFCLTMTTNHCKVRVPGATVLHEIYVDEPENYKKRWVVIEKGKYSYEKDGFGRELAVNVETGEIILGS